MKISDIDAQDRPRERLLSRGVSVLTSEELLQVIIGSGVKGADVIAISKEILKILENTDGKPKLNDIVAVKGVSQATAAKILASFEIANRFIKTGVKVRTIEDVAMILTDIRNKKQEHFALLTLSGDDRLINRHIVSIGTVNASLIHPRDVFSLALSDNAANIIVAHNHPGGSLTPNPADIQLTHRLKEVGQLIGINMQNHVIITKEDAVVVNV